MACSSLAPKMECSIPDVDALPAAPALDYVGYGGLPNLTLNENAQIVDAIGTPFGVGLGLR